MELVKLVVLLHFPIKIRLILKIKCAFLAILRVMGVHFPLTLIIANLVGLKLIICSNKVQILRLENV